jgi:hypothetical protein
MSATNRPFDSETLALLKAVFEEACALLPRHRRTHEMRSALAVCILKHAAKGERDPARLRMCALTETIKSQPSPAVPSRRPTRAWRAEYRSQ